MPVHARSLTSGVAGRWPFSKPGKNFRPARAWPHGAAAARRRRRNAKIPNSAAVVLFSRKGLDCLSRKFPRPLRARALTPRLDLVLPPPARHKTAASTLERARTSLKVSGHDARLVVRILASAAVRPRDAACALKDGCRKPAKPSVGSGMPAFGVCGRIETSGMIARDREWPRSGPRVEQPTPFRPSPPMCTRAATCYGC